YVAGSDLKEILRTKGRIPLADALELTRQVAEALVSAHAQGVLHRDIKPSNILVERASGRAIVTDFGVAKLMGPPEVGLTGTQVGIGTTRYCAREQIRMERQLDGRVDVFSLGAVLCEMATGRSLHGERSDEEIFHSAFSPTGRDPELDAALPGD